MKNTLKLFVISIITWEAKIVLKKYKPKIIAITGSVGKTSTKDVIFTALSGFSYVRKSQKSFNSEIGVPLTILGCPNGWNDPIIWLKNILEGLALIVFPNHYPKWLVLEIGADRPGDILSICKLITPDIVVVTRLSKVPVHVEFFPSVNDVFKEKGHLVQALSKDGTLILNADDSDVLAYSNLVDNKVISYGTLDIADITGKKYGLHYGGRGDKRVPTGISFIAGISGEEEKIEINGALGVQQMYPALAAIAVGSALGLPLAKLAETLKGHLPPPGRMRVLEGIKNTTIIDDTYNSSPVAMEEALKTLQLVETKGRKIAVIGDMLELGVFAAEEHKKIGIQASAIAQKLFTVGIRSRGVALGALEFGMHESNIFQYEDSKTAGKDLEIMIQEGDVILVKGSQGVRMERIVEEIMAEPEEKDKLLVRQDPEWANR